MPFFASRRASFQLASATPRFGASWRLVPFVLIASFVFFPALAIAGPFSSAIDYAQRRTVKIYGAAVGRVTGYATGIIVSHDGFIVTAQGIHLSADRIRVTLHGGSQQDARVIRRNHDLNLALLKVDDDTPDYFELSDTPVGQNGDWILAMSNAFKVADGAEPLSANLGILSLRTRLQLKRGVQDFNYDGDVLLIDAITSNPGAPGGAIVTADSRLAGMIGKVIESKSTNTRINYAVPVDLLAKFVAGTLDRAIPTTSPDTKATVGLRLFQLGGRKAPAFIDRVQPGSPAAQAGLRPDDLIISIAGKAVPDASRCESVLKSLKPDVEITVVVKRKQQLMQIQVTPTAEEQ